MTCTTALKTLGFTRSPASVLVAPGLAARKILGFHVRFHGII
jgi:hypothetical protein